MKEIATMVQVRRDNRENEWRHKRMAYANLGVLDDLPSPRDAGPCRTGTVWGTHTHDMESNHVKFQLVNNIKVSDTQEAKVILQ